MIRNALLISQLHFCAQLLELTLKGTFLKFLSIKNKREFCNT